MYLGENLGYARTGEHLHLDGREMENVFARLGRGVLPGVYRVTSTSGGAPDDVSYFGEYVSSLEDAFSGLERLNPSSLKKE